ncbi:MAG: hypothetical protein K0M78_09190, partial [Brevundimonas sp.]|nr:hypothetical protein [Brevundimonas sp.]
QAASGTGVVEVRSGAEPVEVVADAEGRWSLILPAHEGPEQIHVNGRDFSWPGEGSGSPELTAERTESGWRIRWAGPGGAGQTTWLPDLAP